MACAIAVPRRRTGGPRGRDGRFLGYRRAAELFPRISARDVARALRDPRRCPYIVTWHFGGSALCTRNRPTAPPLRGRLWALRDGAALVLPTGERVEVLVGYRPLPFGGWRAHFLCPRCNSSTRFLYDVGAPYGRGELRCRRCGWLKYRCEGLFVRRLERKLIRLCGTSVSLRDAPWEARLAAVA